MDEATIYYFLDIATDQYVFVKLHGNIEDPTETTAWLVHRTRTGKEVRTLKAQGYSLHHLIRNGTAWTTAKPKGIKR